MPELSLKRKAQFALLLISLVSLPVLIAAELYVRRTSTYGYVTPETLQSMTPDYQPAVFARHVIQPRAKTAVVNGKELFRINSHGYRGREFAAAKPPGTTRVMFYGGSSVFDADSPGEDDWPHRVERNLKARGFGSVEVINAGIPGFSSAEAVGTFFAEGHRFAPDYVLLYAQWNDIKLLRSPDPLLRQFARAEVWDDPRTTYQNILDRLLSNTSQLYVRLRARYYTWKLRIGDEGITPVGDYASSIDESALRQYRLNVQTFVDIARNIGAVPILMIEARLVAPGNTAEEKSRISYDYVLLTHEALCNAFDRQDRVLYDVGREKSARVLDRPARELTGKGDLFANHIHVNPKGSARLAELVADELAPILQDGPGGVEVR
jgi:lysophospholipase L1-like esterase